MARKLLCYLIFILLETLIILGSAVIVVCFYLPFVAMKGLVLTAIGKATPRIRTGAPLTSTNG